MVLQPRHPQREISRFKPQFMVAFSLSPPFGDYNFFSVSFSVKQLTVLWTRMIFFGRRGSERTH